MNKCKSLIRGGYKDQYEVANGKQETREWPMTSVSTHYSTATKTS